MSLLNPRICDLPEARRVINGRTFAAMYDPLNTGLEVEPDAPWWARQAFALAVLIVSLIALAAIVYAETTP